LARNAEKHFKESLFTWTYGGSASAAFYWTLFTFT